VGSALLASVVIATQAFGSAGNEFRTASVADRNVDAVLTSAATVEPVSQAAVAFPVSGTVASVDVKIDDKVIVGQTLASLDPATLTETLHEKQATLAQAELSLKQALSGQQVTRSRGGTGGSGGASSSGTPQASGATSHGTASVSLISTSGAIEVQLISASSSVSATSSDPAIAQAQQAVLAAQHNVDLAIAAADTALATADTACAADLTIPANITSCQSALAAVQAAQNDVKAAQNKLVDASNLLDQLLEQQANTPPSGGGSPGGGTGGAPSGSPGGGTGGAPSGSTDTSGAGSAPSGSTGGTLSGGGGSASPSSADLIAYQKAIDAAAAEVTVAQQSLAQAVIASPLDGTVVAVNLAAVDTVEAASTTANVVVQGAGGYEITTTVGIDRISDVAVGQRATFVPDGSHRALGGDVVYISAVPSSTSATTSYLVVVGLNKSKADLNNGSTGTVRIVTESAKSALAVPTSAITTTGARHTVEVLKGDGTRRVIVRVGAVGETWTEITDGLTSGQVVVLANLSDPLPGSATDSSNGTQGGGFPPGIPNGVRFGRGGGG
jgi:HlyD family secretion protein